MEVAILTPAIKKLSLRTGKHSHPSLDDLKPAMFLVYAKQINIKGDLSHVVVTAHNTAPQGSLPPPAEGQYISIPSLFAYRHVLLCP